MPFPRSATLRLVAATMVVALAACTSASTEDAPATSPTASDAPSAASAPNPAVSPGTSSPSDDAPPDETPSDDAPPDETPPDETPSDDAATDGQADGCSDDDRVALVAVVEDQLAAFADEDFEAARELASASFRESIDLATFEELITEQYGVVLTDPAVAVEACATDGERAVLAVELTAPDGSTAEVAYLLAREDGAWRIEGAQTSDVPGGGDLGVTV